MKCEKCIYYQASPALGWCECESITVSSEGKPCEYYEENSKKGFYLSMNSTAELKKMILDNPELQLLIFAGEEAYTGEYGYNQANVWKYHIKELTMYGDAWMDKEDLTDTLENNLCDNVRYVGMTESQFDEMLADRVDRTGFVKAIVIYVG